MASISRAPSGPSRPWYRQLSGQVLLAVALGALVGSLIDPIAQGLQAAGVESATHDGLIGLLQAIGTFFIKLIKMVVGPIIFCTVVTGIAAMDDMQSAGRVGGKALLYFLCLTAFSLTLGLTVANVVKPGAGMNIDPASLNLAALKNLPAGAAAKESGVLEFVLHIIPKTFVSAFVDGELLQVLLVSLLFAAATVFMGDRARPMVAMLDSVSHVFFGIVGIIMKIAPLAAFGAMAFTVGHYGIGALLPLAKLVLCFFATCAAFLVLVVGTMVRLAGLSFWRYLLYIKEEILIVFGTCSSETAFPRMIDKLTQLGCDRSVVGLVLPTGYSFNLDGTSIYLSMAAIFLAQATNTPMSLGEELALVGVMMLTSKGAAGVVGTAFVALTATLASMGHIPVAAVTIILGIDNFMAQGRSVTNLIGNGAATILMAKWEGRLDQDRARKVLAGEIVPALETSSRIGAHSHPGKAV